MTVTLQLVNAMSSKLFTEVLLAVVIIGEGYFLAEGFNSTAVAPTPSTAGAVNVSVSPWLGSTEGPTSDLESSGSGSGSGSGFGSGFGSSGGTVKCPEVLRLGWNDQLTRTPYAKPSQNPHTGKMTCTDGFMPFLLLQLIEICCSEIPVLQDNMTNMFDDVESESDIVLPVMINFRDVELVSQVNVVSLLPNTGVVFLVPKRKKGYAMKMLVSIASTWPVLVLTLALSLLAGIIAWCLDTRTNPEHFPTRFIDGTWEGFWWAFVSMTTVGYGDRSPKSILGRLFAVMWILVGICICSIFTATLTTSLTTISLDTRVSLSGSRVAAMVNSIEAVTGFNYQADVVRVSKIEEIRERLDSGDVVGTLLDSYTIAAHRNMFPRDTYEIQDIIPQDYLEYGARVKNNDLGKCMRNFRYSEESAVFEILEFYNNGSLKSGLGESSDESKGIFDPDGLLFLPTLLGCIGLVGIFSIMGLIWEGYRHWKARRELRRGRNQDSVRSRMIIASNGFAQRGQTDSMV